MICDRVIIIDKGKIIAEGTCDELKKLAKIEEKITIEVSKIEEKNIEEIRANKNVEDVLYENNVLFIIYDKGKNNLENLIDYMKDNKIKYSSIYSERPTLNDVFLELTGKELRD